MFMGLKASGSYHFLFIFKKERLKNDIYLIFYEDQENPFPRPGKMESFQVKT